MKSINLLSGKIPAPWWTLSVLTANAINDDLEIRKKIPTLPCVCACVPSGVDRRLRLLLEKTRPFILMDGQRRSLSEALQVIHMNMSATLSKVMMSSAWSD